MLISRRELAEAVEPAIRGTTTGTHRWLIFDLVHMGYVVFHCGYGRPRPEAAKDADTLLQYLKLTGLLRDLTGLRLRPERRPQRIPPPEGEIVVTSADLALLADHFHRLVARTPPTVPLDCMNRWLTKAWTMGEAEHRVRSASGLPMTKEWLAKGLVPHLMFIMPPNGWGTSPL